MEMHTCVALDWDPQCQIDDASEEAENSDNIITAIHIAQVARNDTPEKTRFL